MAMNSGLLTPLTTALAPILWGTTYLATTELLPSDRPIWAAAIRTLPAGVLITLYARRLPGAALLGRTLILSLLNIGLFQALLFVAAYRLPGGLAAVFGACQPLIVMALCWAVDAQRPRGLAAAAGIVGVCGVAALMVAPSAQWDSIGAVAAAAGALCMATGTFLTKRWGSSEPPLTMTGWQLLFGGMFLLPVAALLEAPPLELTPRNVAGYVYLGTLGTLVAYALWFRGARRLPATTTSSLTLLSPFTAVLLGWFVLGQSLSLTQWVGSVAVLASVLALQFVGPVGRARDAFVRSAAGDRPL